MMLCLTPCAQRLKILNKTAVIIKPDVNASTAIKFSDRQQVNSFSEILQAVNVSRFAYEDNIVPDLP